MGTAQILFSKNLKAIREEKKISQLYIAERSNMQPATYNRIENMKVSPSIDTIERIAMAVDVPIAELFRSREVADKPVDQKLEMITSLSAYNRSVVGILLDSIIEKDKLEKLQEVKMKSRLVELEKVRKK